MRDIPSRSVGRLLGLVLFSAALAFGSPLEAQVGSDLFESMAARNIGPAGMSGRITAVDVDLRDRARIFVGAASGGVWRSESGGVTWTPIFDEEFTQSIGHIVISRANPDLVWVGTGEGNPRQSVSAGNGVYKSVDGGDSWTHVGLEGSERITRMAAHPTNPDILYVGALGPLWNTGGERGLYKTTDGGESWERILYVDEQTGVADLEMDPVNPDKMIVAMYDVRRWPWYFESGGLGSGIYLTRDGGTTWTKLGPEHGIPEGPLGRIGLAIAPSKRNVIYALVEATTNALLRSDDGGQNWRVVNDEPGISPRPMYYSDLRVDPKNENRIYRLGNNPDVSEDGGLTWRVMVPSRIIHGDHHALWIDPDDPRRMVNGNDGGIGITYDGGDFWRFVTNLPVSQFYKVSVDMAVPFNVYGGVQDSGSWMGPSTVWHDRGITNSHWRRVNGADGFATMVDFSNPRYGYTTSQNGRLLRFDKETMERRIIQPEHPDGLPLRFNWNSPLAVDAIDSTSIYFGSQFVHRSANGGRTWEIISPDLTTNHTPKCEPETVGAPLSIEVDNHCTLLSIEPSPLEAGLIWASSDDGNIQVTRDGGATWTNVANNLPSSAPDSAYVPQVKASRHAAGRAYVVVDDHRRGDMAAYLYRTDDYGASWRALSTEGIGFAHAIEEDPVEPDLLFLGTEFGMWVSLDAGATWLKWTHGLPNVPVRQIVVHPRDHDLVIGTHGRGIWIVDDVQPLREITRDPTIMAESARLLPPPPAQQHEVALRGDLGIHLGYRVVGHTTYFGESRPYGAILSYWLGTGAAGSDVRIHIRRNGVLVRELPGPSAHGVNRVVWDLRPEENQSEEVAPGLYEVVLQVAGSESQGTVDVLPDPRKEGVSFFPDGG